MRRSIDIIQPGEGFDGGSVLSGEVQGFKPSFGASVKLAAVMILVSGALRGEVNSRTSFVEESNSKMINANGVGSMLAEEVKPGEGKGEGLPERVLPTVESFGEPARESDEDSSYSGDRVCDDWQTEDVYDRAAGGFRTYGTCYDSEGKVTARGGCAPGYYVSNNKPIGCHPIDVDGDGIGDMPQ